MEEAVVMDLLDDSGELQKTSELDTVLGRPVFGIMPTSDLLLWETMLSVVDLGYTPAEAMDLVALEFEIYPEAGYAMSRGVPEKELRADLDDMIDEMVASAAN